MRILREVGLLTFRCIKTCLRNPVFLFMGVITPAIYLAFFTPLLSKLMMTGALGGNNVLSLFIPGMLPIIAFSTGLFTGFGTIDEVRSGVLERLRVTPASRFSILFGQVLFDVCSTYFQASLFVLIGLFCGFRASVPGMMILFVLLALLAITTSSFGNALGVITKSEDKYAPVVHGINLPILLLSGTLLPMSLAPKWLNVVAHFNPVYYVVEAARSLAAGDLWGEKVLYAFLAMTLFSVMTTMWATRVYRKAIT